MPRKTKAKAKKRPAVQRKACFFCQRGAFPDWKNPQELRQLTTERGKILAASKTGLCLKHQRKLTLAVKRARFIGFLPYVAGLK